MTKMFLALAIASLFVSVSAVNAEMPPFQERSINLDLTTVDLDSNYQILNHERPFSPSWADEYKSDFDAHNRSKRRSRASIVVDDNWTLATPAGYQKKSQDERKRIIILFSEF